MENISVNGSGSEKRVHLFLLAAFGVVLIWSLIDPHDYLTWFLEVFPALIGLGFVLATYKRFTLTTLLYTLLFMHASVLFIGGHYTYAEMPLFNWLRDTYHLDRNYYDRVGHFFQGFVPAIIARELLLRRTPLQRGRWLVTIVISICLAISALYELLEWRVAVALQQAADQFLATQGDVWDTQWDMSFALIGSITAQVLLSRLHDRQLAPFLRGKSRESITA